MMISINYVKAFLSHVDLDDTTYMFHAELVHTFLSYIPECIKTIRSNEEVVPLQEPSLI